MRMPKIWLDAHIEMKPILEARENLTNLQIALMANGRLSKSDYDAIVRAWKNEAGVAPARLKAEQFLAYMGSIGLGVKGGIRPGRSSPRAED